MQLDIEVGMTAKLTHTVAEQDTAYAFEASQPKVYATPWLTALIELASYEIIKPHLPSGYSAVGTIVNIKHLAATPIGMKVWAVSTVVGIDRRRISFRAEAFDETGKIGEAEHERFIIESDKFTQKTYEKADT